MQTLAPSRAIVALAGFASLLGLSSAHAATPASGTIGPTNTHLSYTFPAQPTANVTGNIGDTYTCNTDATDPCDVFLLTIDFPANYASAHPNMGVRISATTTSTASDIDMQLADDQGNLIFVQRDNPPDQPTISFLPGNNTTRELQVQVVPSTPTEGGSVTIDLVDLGSGAQTLPPPVAAPGTSQPPPIGVPPASPDEPRYLQQQAPPGIGDDTGAEMNVGYNPFTGRFMFLGNLNTYRLTVPEAVDDPLESLVKLPENCTGLWEDVSYPPTTAQTGDPILSTDPGTGRTFVSQLTGTPTGDSVYAFSDDDGDTWTQGTATNDGALDHQSMVSGPYAAGQGPSPTSTYPNVVNYCSQSLPNGVIGCVRSDDGGLTFGPPTVAALSYRDCPNDFQFIHGHIRYTPDGTLYIPVNNCEGHQAILVSSDSGSTYQMHPDTTSSPPNGLMHSAIAPSLDGSTLYHCYVNANGEMHVTVSHDKAVTWGDDHDVGAPAGLAQAVFPAAVAGDADRATCGFLGTTTLGNYAALDFPGIWYAYMATTYDGGKTWRTVIASPGNPVQGVGGICTAGTQPCLAAHRNLLDFNEMVMDSRGYPLYAYDDGCINGCDADPVNAVNYNAKTALIRQVGGRGLVASLDSAEPTAPHRTCMNGTRNALETSLFWRAPDHGGETITGYRIYRGTALNAMASIGETGSATHYVDVTANKDTAYYYKVGAINAHGESALSNALLLEPSDVLPPSACVAPGLQLITDPAGDTNNGLPTQQDDLEWVGFAEPNDLDNRLVVTMKVNNLTPAPPSGYRWLTLFDIPGSEDRYWIGMSASEGVPQYNYGTVENQPTPGTSGVGVYTVVGDLDASSGYNTDGTITLVLDKSVLGLKTHDALTNISASIRQSTADTAGARGLTVDSASASGPYVLLGNATCLGAGGPANLPSGSGVLLSGALGAPMLLVLSGLGALRLRRRRR